MSTVRMELFYVRDKDGTLWLVLDRKNCLHKINKSGEWATDTGGVWMKVDPETHIADHNHQIFADVLNLSAIPEPSWKDEKPMSIFLTLTSSINYAFNT